VSGLRNFPAQVSILQDLSNVEVLSLSVNRIASLHFFAYCTKLQELYLRKNSVSNLDEVTSACNALGCHRARLLSSDVTRVG
jgi:Leucine-rich repeat (LRR) protein